MLNDSRCNADFKERNINPICPIAQAPVLELKTLLDTNVTSPDHMKLHQK